MIFDISLMPEIPLNNSSQMIFSSEPAEPDLTNMKSVKNVQIQMMITYSCQKINITAIN